MLNHYPAWKNITVVLVVAVGLLLALPNIFGEDYAVQVSHSGSSGTTQATLDKVTGILKSADMDYKSAGFQDKLLLVRFDDPEQQLKAADKLKAELGDDYVVALNRAPRTPEWLRAMGMRPMSLGLDLRGGVHFLLEVDMKTAVAQAVDRYEKDIKTELRDKRIRYQSAQVSGNGLTIGFRTPEDLQKARDLISEKHRDLQIETVENARTPTLSLRVSEKELRDIKKNALEQNITTLRNRVNELGVAEPIVQQQGDSRIVVQLPGVQDTARAKEILGSTATLEFRLVYQDGNPYEAERTGHVPLGAKLYHTKDGDRPVLLKRDVVVTGDELTGASAGFDSQTGGPAVIVNLDSKGAAKMAETTKRNLNKPMAVVFIENKPETHEVDGKIVKTHKKVEQVINIATIKGIFSSRFQITGLAPQESQDLALLLRAGSLAAPMDIVEERTVGPSLGKDNINQGFEAVVIGFLLVVGFMAVYYKVFGLIADLALFMNLVLIVGLLSLLQATLTLPGIAGIVLTVGMAVDANVLIFERIREELRNGNTPQASIHAGYEKAFSTIADANVTTLIAGIVLFSFGTGPVKGFAVTLSLGIVTSMFTAIMGSRAIVNWLYGGKRLTRLSV
ncbi:MAG: protein translocase subunit SecD [Gammaproteobacteria bacterium]|jgi:preprotein translocase subunit SecD